jgi:hypothetical protein
MVITDGEWADLCRITARYWGEVSEVEITFPVDLPGRA